MKQRLKNEAMVTSIPYPDNSFDIVMSGRVVGDE